MTAFRIDPSQRSRLVAKASDTALALHIGGQAYQRWSGVRVRRSLEELAHGFELSLVDEWLPQSKPIPVEEGQLCAVLAGDETLITGYIDDVNIEYDGASHELTVAGRSMAGDLCDCTAAHGSGQWKSAPLLQIASDLCKPFALDVSADVDLGSALKSFTLQDGETVFAALERGARYRGVLCTSTPDGDVVFTQAGSTRTASKLELGKNILTGNVRGTWRERFSQYTVKGQSKGNDQWNGKQASQGKATASDSEVGRYRPLTVQLEDQISSGLDRRARWEANVRAGRSRRYTYLTPGWTCAEGIWKPNVMVHVLDPFLELDQELLIVSVTLARDEQGTVTELELMEQAAFQQIPVPPKKPKRDKAKVNW